MDEELDNGEADLIDLKVDASTMVLAAVFGTASFPPDMPERIKAAILDRAEQLRNADGSLILDDRLRTDKQRRDEAGKDDVALTLWSQIVEDEQREREEWMHMKSTFAGVTMTGAEWKGLSEDLRREGSLRDWLIEQMMRDGKPREAAERKADEMADVYGAMAKPPSQRTEEEAASIERAKSDPDYQRYTAQLAAQQGRADMDNDQRKSVTMGQASSVEARNDAFASVSNLSEHHRGVSAATQSPSPQAPLPKVQPAPGMAGLEI